MRSKSIHKIMKTLSIWTLIQILSVPFLPIPADSYRKFSRISVSLFYGHPPLVRGCFFMAEGVLNDRLSGKKAPL